MLKYRIKRLKRSMNTIYPLFDSLEVKKNYEDLQDLFKNLNVKKIKHSLLLLTQISTFRYIDDGDFVLNSVRRQ